ncbi:GNAT family N-acetyltransferase [Enterococcus sp. LJL90]
MKIVTYKMAYKDEFIEMNKAWIAKMFVIETEDLRELENIESYIEAGGQIFFAINEDDIIMACCMIAPRDDGDWEIMKFAAKEAYSGSGAGSACLEACIDYARQKKIQKLLIVTNTNCIQAIHLYKKFGFSEIPVDKEKFPFDRANIAFEKKFIS